MNEMAGMPISTSGVQGLSADGNVAVGGVQQGVDLRAVRWTLQTGPVDLGTMPGGTGANAFGTNSDGSVIVGYGNTVGTTHGAFRWSAGSGMVSLGGLPGQTFFSEARAVSADGLTVVGEAQFGATPRAVRWTPQGIISLGPITEVATAVSADGSVIGGYGADAFLWTAQTGTVNLKTYLISLGAGGLSGWTLDTVSGISADGRVVVGTGTNPSGHEEGYYAVVPAPGSVLVIGGLGLAALRRRR